MKARFPTALICVCLLALVPGCGKKGDQAANEGGEQSSSLVEVTVAELGDLSRTVEFTGTVESSEDSMVAAKVGGKVVSIAADEGDHVAAGAVLVAIDSSDYSEQARQAESGLRVAKARLDQAKTQKGIGDASIDAEVAQAEAALRAAQARLKMVRDGARPQERTQAEAAERAARSSLQTAQADFDRMKSLYGEGAISRQMYDNAKLGLDVAKSQYEQAKAALSLVREGARPEEIEQAEAQVEQAQNALSAALADRDRKKVLAGEVETAGAGAASAEAAYAIAASQLADTQVKAPFSGYLAARLVDPGEVVAPGTPVVSLVSLDGLFVRADVSEKEIERIRAGMPVRVSIDAIPDESFAATVREILPSARTDSRNFSVKIALKDPKNRLRPGMFARAHVILETLKDVITVPKRVLFERAGKSYVFVVKGRVAVMKEVTSGVHEEEVVQITSGVEPGDRVILSGQERLKDGEKVRVTQ
jgi:HlyD family secretion protein